MTSWRPLSGPDVTGLTITTTPLFNGRGGGRGSTLSHTWPRPIATWQQRVGLASKAAQDTPPLLGNRTYRNTPRVVCTPHTCCYHLCDDIPPSRLVRHSRKIHEKNIHHNSSLPAKYHLIKTIRFSAAPT